MFEQITILGPGLLGASLAMAVKARGLTTSVHSWSRRPETRAKCMRHHWCDAVFETASEACEGSDLVIICTPVQTIAPLIKEVSHSLKPKSLVTDVGSTKSLICRQSANAVPSGVTFIGSHPMAGSERSGLEHADVDLFTNATCLITPLPHAPSEKIAQLIAFWEALEMQIATVSPEKHDEIVAHISHLPHLLASTVCSLLAQKDPIWGNFSGGGLRDSTRVASGDPYLWKQILEQNREEVIRAIDSFEGELHKLKSALLNQESHSLTQLLKRGKQYRDQL
ncbi:MAG TPA: prephenate dehydrogenase/arogenate dehydrogenase family protein [Opitutae bacterium]|nr:prephenate dehydrogenase/arogenate dehydrogenase family protein [Opitutae bacterium]